MEPLMGIKDSTFLPKCTGILKRILNPIHRSSEEICLLCSRQANMLHKSNLYTCQVKFDITFKEKKKSPTCTYTKITLRAC